MKIEESSEASESAAEDESGKMRSCCHDHFLSPIVGQPPCQTFVGYAVFGGSSACRKTLEQEGALC